MTGRPEIKRNIYIAGIMPDQAAWNDLVCRLCFYFSPYLDFIDRIEVSAPQIVSTDNIAVPETFDPRISHDLPEFLEKFFVRPDAEIVKQLERADSRRHLFLLADDSRVESMDAQIHRFRSDGHFYRVDARRVRMEGSFFLWCGANVFRDVTAETAFYRDRFARMTEEIGHYENVHVFGTGPSLSEYVEKNDFAGDLTIVANSIVKNHDMLDKLAPKIIVAGDPIFHAGCSSYAAAFRAALIEAMERTGAWFVCPLRDIGIYTTYLPSHMQDRIVGIPFDHAAPPPTNLRETFVLKPYGNILTLLLLPLASTFGREVRIAGCDGRPVTENASFWSHDAKAQFTGEMENIRRVHPGFFAIDYNDYYFEHARNLETVLNRLEAAGRRCVSACRSYIPALHRREPEELRPLQERAGRPFHAETLAILDPDAKGDWGHFLAYDRRLGVAAKRMGLQYALIGRKDLAPQIHPSGVDRVLRVFSHHSWTLGNKWPKVKIEDVTAFAFEIDAALTELEAAEPEGDILIFMYCGALEIVEMLEHVLIYHPRVRAMINLFWAYNFEVNDPVYSAHWRDLLKAVSRNEGRVRVTHSTPQMARGYREAWGIDIPVLPHPSTTFGDAQARKLAAMPARKHIVNQRPRVLFPSGSRIEKGYLPGALACGQLAHEGDLDLQLRARIDRETAPELRAAVAAIDPKAVSLVTGDLSEDDFVDWLASADVMVVPYLPEAFSSRTSGMLVDANLLGIPLVVVKGTWLADELAETGAGIAVDPTPEAIVAGVRAVLANYTRYSAASREAAKRYLKTSTWTMLARHLVNVASCTVSGHLGGIPAPAETWHWDGSNWHETEAAEANLIFLRAPYVYLAAAAEYRISARQAIETWCIAADHTLALLRAAPQTRTVMMIESGLSAGMELSDALARRLGTQAPDRLPDVRDWDIPAPVLQLAAVFVDRTPQVAERLELLGAAGIAQPGSQSIAPSDDAMRQILSWARDADRLARIEKFELSELRQARENDAATLKLLYAQIAQLKATLEDFDRQGELDRKAVMVLENELSKLRQVHSSRELEVADILRSSSWRLTRPLRVAARAVKRIPTPQKDDPKR